MATPLFTIPQTQIHVESDYSLLVITHDVFCASHSITPVYEVSLLIRL